MELAVSKCLTIAQNLSQTWVSAEYEQKQRLQKLVLPEGILYNKQKGMDPTFSAFVMNEKGDLLSIEEVRERLINSKPLLLNPDANWNNQTIQKRENYLDNYMAKNLYMLECPVSSEYNMETATNGKVYTYVKLLPLDYHEQMPDKVEEKEKKSGSSWVTYKTNNPNIFWKKPE